MKAIVLDLFPEIMLPRLDKVRSAQNFGVVWSNFISIIMNYDSLPIIFDRVIISFFRLRDLGKLVDLIAEPGQFYVT